MKLLDLRGRPTAMLSVCSNKPILYDVFCCAGGAAKGYQNAGFYVIGIDNRPQPRYCGDQFIQMDAFEFIDRYLNGEYPEASIFHASPPCQVHSVTASLSNGTHLDLVPQTRAALIATGKPYVIENVPGAPLINPLMLCGTMFGLNVIRHRLFECNPVVWFPPANCKHDGKTGTVRSMRQRMITKVPRFSDGYKFISISGNGYAIAEGRLAMAIDWMTTDELSQAIPPAYTEWLGGEMMRMLEVAR